MTTWSAYPVTRSMRAAPGSSGFIHGRHGHNSDSLYKARWALRAGAEPLTEKQDERLRVLFVSDQHVVAEAVGEVISAWSPPTVNRTRPEAN